MLKQLATTTRGGLGASRSSPGPTGAYPGPASRGIQFLYPPTVNDHSGPLFTPRHGGTSPRPLPAPLLCRLRIGPAHGSVTLTSLGVPTLTQPPRSTLCRRPGANRPRSEARYTAFGTRPRPRALGRAPPAPSPTKSLADITRDLVRADTQLHSHLATRGDYHPRQIPGTPPSLAYPPRTATPRHATSATPQHRQARFTPRRRYNAAPPTQTGQACSRRGGLGGQIHGHNPLEVMELREGARLQG